ncbi:MAG: hypothetical protein ACK5MN_05640 [Lachnospiraceae bacterium]
MIKYSNGDESKTHRSVAVLVKQNDVSFIHQRFELILSNKKNRDPRLKWTILSTVFLTFFLSYFILVQAAFYPPASELTGQIEITSTNSYILVDKNDRMELYVNNEFQHVVSPQELYAEPYSMLKIIRAGQVK